MKKFAIYYVILILLVVAICLTIALWPRNNKRTDTKNDSTTTTTTKKNYNEALPITHNIGEDEDDESDDEDDEDDDIVDEIVTEKHYRYKTYFGEDGGECPLFEYFYIGNKDLSDYYNTNYQCYPSFDETDNFIAVHTIDDSTCGVGYSYLDVYDFEGNELLSLGSSTKSNVYDIPKSMEGYNLEEYNVEGNKITYTYKTVGPDYCSLVDCGGCDEAEYDFVLTYKIIPENYDELSAKKQEKIDKQVCEILNKHKNEIESATYQIEYLKESKKFSQPKILSTTKYEKIWKEDYPECFK